MDWMRLAAFIDGEGCICIVGSLGLDRVNRKRRILHLKLEIVNTDIRLSDWCRSTFGGTVYCGAVKNEPTWKPKFHWEIHCRGAKWVLENCLPYFLLKKEQAEIALAFTKTLNRWGVKGAPEEIQVEQWQLRSALNELKGRRTVTSNLRIHPPKNLKKRVNALKSTPENGEQKEKDYVQ
jgi:hypothetical protein